MRIATETRVATLFLVRNRKKRSKSKRQFELLRHLRQLSSAQTQPCYYSEYNKSAVDTVADSGRDLHTIQTTSFRDFYFSVPFERQLSRQAFPAFKMNFCELQLILYRVQICDVF